MLLKMCFPLFSAEITPRKSLLVREFFLLKLNFFSPLGLIMKDICTSQ